jgi:hypothetical protein
MSQSAGLLLVPACAERLRRRRRRRRRRTSELKESDIGTGCGVFQARAPVRISQQSKGYVLGID